MSQAFRPADGMMFLRPTAGAIFLEISLADERRLVQPDPSAFVADPELIHALLARAELVQCNADRLLFAQDEPACGVYILERGTATISMSSVAGDTIFSIDAPPGSLLGVPAVVGEHPYSLTAIARAGSRVRFVSCKDFSALVHADPQL